MADRFTPTERSVLMSGIKSKNTRFELDFVALLKKKTRAKLETHARDVKGTPDVVFRRAKLCVFLDSDFWHGWQYPRWKKTLKNDFWRTKIERNRVRDRKTTRYLRRHGWSVIRLWEHSIKRDSVLALEKIKKQLSKK